MSDVEIMPILPSPNEHVATWYGALRAAQLELIDATAHAERAKLEVLKYRRVLNALSVVEAYAAEQTAKDNPQTEGKP